MQMEHKNKWGGSHALTTAAKPDGLQVRRKGQDVGGGYA